MTGRILLVRPEPGASASAEKARALGLDPVTTPLFTVRPVAWEPPPAAGFDALLITSANAMRHGGLQLQNYTDLPVYAVGDTTAEAARAAGFADIRVGPADVETLLGGVGDDLKLLHLCGRDHVRLERNGILQVPVYASDATDRLPDEAAAALRGGALALLHSPRAAALFAKLVDDARISRDTVDIAAISANAAQAAGAGWKRIEAASGPRDDLLLELAARMAGDKDVKAMDMTDASFEPAPAAETPVRPRRKGKAFLFLLPLLAFLIGLAAMAWILTRWEAGAQYLGIVPRPTAPAAAPPQVMAPPASVAIVDPEVSRRVAVLEQRLSEVANQSQAAVGNADRAEGLLVAFAARRALDRGVALGYIEGLLRERFAATQPQAVGTIIGAAREPITLQELQEGLRAIGPTLAGAGPEQNWWTAFKAELGSLVTIRKEGTPSTVPAERVTRATQRLEAGQVDVALAEILRLPGHQAAADWIADARRYIAARRALDTIETAALLEPRAGQAPVTLPVETPSPARPAA